ncbi:hypothetical protein TVAG_124910 [Trichomonas vaginalis G3]|uniref:Uncharacterized protein n=1 Tax=Trichomonas vaginalis (strain ATCC PRA-98 / G3) TaxID=412133 RepID=A2EIJ7_TRIV3|nr:guanylate cyclase protein [Trichomonas vaginalis G3]EAY07518.1 hypothetical protein TVAG_124910 [Trichomonas vaginalis G3]KAI5550528.1 guanylate cyclase protein [Trichomonas vaginalis G3]|eukprot:XP_001319741.1 hypothetical protein [Trichomonas vaginalis G3]
MSRNLENMTKAAVDAPNLEISYFEEHAVKSQSNRAIWKESLLAAPNNPKFCEEYARYLIEAECDFPEGLKIKNRQQSIEMGKIYSVDFSFRSMVEAFPKYLTEKILDLNGGVRKKETSSNGAPTSGRSTTGSQGSNQSTGTDETTELEAEVEEFIGKRTIKQARERLALHRMMENKLSSPIKTITPISIFIILFIVIIFCIGVTTATIQLQTYVNDMKLLSSIADTRFFVSLSNSGMIAEFFREAQQLQKYTTPMKQYLRDSDKPYLDLYNFMLPSLINFTTIASQAYETFNNLATEQALSGFNVSLTTEGLLTYDTIFTTCPLGVETPTSLSNLVGVYLVDQRIISGKPHVLDILTNMDSYEISLNFVNFFSHMDTAFADITNEQYDLGKTANKYFRNLSIIIPVITFVGVFIPFFINHYRVQRSLKELIEIIHSLDSKSKQEAKELIMVGQNEDEMKVTEMRSKTYYSTSVLIFICIISIIFLGLTFAGSRLVLMHSTQLMNLNSCNKYASQRLCLSAEAFSLLFTLTVVHTFPNVNQYRNVSVLSGITMVMAKMIVDADNNLLNGDSKTPPCQGFNEELDQLNFIDGALQNNVNDPSEYYANASIHTQVETFYAYLSEITK